MPVVQLLLGDGLEVEDRQRLLRRRDQLARGAALAERLLAERVEDRRGERDLRQRGAGGQHAQKLAPVGPRDARSGMSRSSRQQDLTVSCRTRWHRGLGVVTNPALRAGRGHGQGRSGPHAERPGAAVGSALVAILQPRRQRDAAVVVMPGSCAVRARPGGDGGAGLRRVPRRPGPGSARGGARHERDSGSRRRNRTGIEGMGRVGDGDALKPAIGVGRCRRT